MELADFRDAIAVLRALEREGVEYALVGSMAMAAQGLVRATQDTDIFVAPTAENVERLRRALRSVFHDACIEEIVVEDLAGEYPAIRYATPESDFSIDILARLGEAFAYADIETEVLETEGVHVRVATPRSLVRMKRGTVRPIEHADAAPLRDRGRVMAVTRYRDVADMPPPAPRPPLDPDNLRVAFEWSGLIARLHPRERSPGVFRRDLREPATEEVAPPAASRR